VIQSAGYFPNPKLNTAASTMPVATNFVAGQPVFGTYSASGYGDTVTVRFAAGFTGGVADNVYGCTGQQNTSVANFDTFTNKFAVALVNGVPSLVCTFTNGAGTTANIPLVTGVTKLVILYGVKRNGTATGSCADTYLNASQMVAPTDWNAVCTVSVQALFTNPLSTTGATIPIQRVIAVMSTAGA
jgi:type IV pilus assembly protein PilW